jgi:hypothetical protein
MIGIYNLPPRGLVPRRQLDGTSRRTLESAIMSNGAKVMQDALCQANPGMTLGVMHKLQLRTIGLPKQR